MSPEPDELAPLADEQRLDALLLDLLAGRREATSEIFVEERSSERASRCLGERAGPARSPSVRLDEGWALRSSCGDVERSAHVTAPVADEPERLAEALTGSPRPAWPAPRRARPLAPIPAPGGTPCPLDRVVALAGDRFSAELARCSLEIGWHADTRQTHVASSEWGHAQEWSCWCTLQLTVRAARGGVPIRRGLGWASGAAPGDAELRTLLGDAFDAAELSADARESAPGAPALIFAAGSGGVLVHEAVGHLLEGDVALRGASALGDRLGERVARDLTVIDDPTVERRAGTYRRDDEGVAPRPVALLERGVVSGVLTSARFAGHEARRCTGHGRRESHRRLPLPRMSNTIVSSQGAGTADDLVASMGSGIRVCRLDQASVDPLTGELAVRVVEARRVEAGRCTEPLAPFMLHGNSLDWLSSIRDVAGPVEWDDGCGACGRHGQWVRVSVAQPALLCAAGSLHVA